MNVNNNKGFSLVELMVVVAIIGILAAVGIPQFSKFQARSRQSEAKSQLSGIYAAAKSFHAEWNLYYNGLRTIGYGPDARTQLRYNTGFGAGAAAAVPATYTFTAVAGDQSQTSTGTMCMNAGAAAACVFSPAYTVTALPAAPALSTTTFVGIASGNPNAATLANVDTWTIDQDKILSNTLAGIL